MNIKYKYTKANFENIGELSIKSSDSGHQELIKAVLTEIATKENERIVVAIMSTDIEGLQIGVNHFDPIETQPSQQRTIESIQICEDGKNWNNVSIIKT